MSSGILEREGKPHSAQFQRIHTNCLYVEVKIIIIASYSITLLRCGRVFFHGVLNLI